MTVTEEQIGKLATACYGSSESITTDDGTVYRLNVEIDEYTTVEDYECYGRFGWGRDNDYGSVRPDGFSGRARILTRDHHSKYWWEPHPEVPDDKLDIEQRSVRELVENGFYGLVLERCEGTDHYGKPIVRDSASLWGIEGNCDESYAREIVSDLLAELTQ